MEKYIRERIEDRGEQPREARKSSINEQQVRDWIGGLWIELQLIHKELKDYRQALAQTRQKLRELEQEKGIEEVPNGS